MEAKNANKSTTNTKSRGTGGNARGGSAKNNPRGGPRKPKNNNPRGPPKQAGSGPKLNYRPTKKSNEQSQNRQSQPSITKSTIPPTTQDDDNENSCLICCEPIEYFALGICNHRSLCSLCATRRRELYKEKDCCMCKAPQENVIFTKNISDPFSSFNLSTAMVANRKTLEFLSDADSAPSQYLISDPVRGLYFDSCLSHYYEIAKLWDFACSVCIESGEKPSFTNTFQSILSLRKHLKDSHHGSDFCEICLENSKVFLKDQKIYTPRDLDKHCKGVDERATEAHCLCEFCNKLYNNKDALYIHLSQGHFTCFLCERAGMQYQYYKDYKSVERHYDNSHFLCKEKECLDKKFIVFATELDLKGHDVAEHLSNKKLTRAEAKMARTVDPNLFFDLGLRPGATGGRGGGGGGRGGRGRGGQTDTREEGIEIIGTTIGGAPSVRVVAPGGNFSPNYRSNDGRHTYTTTTTTSTTTSTTSSTSTSRGSSGASSPSISAEQEQELKRARNKKLIDRIRKFLGPAKFTQFKKQSEDLRKNRITPAQYYNNYLKTFGSVKGDAAEIFTELVDLLPDPILKKALFTLHKNYLEKERSFPTLADSSSSNGPSKDDGGWSGAVQKQTKSKPFEEQFPILPNEQHSETPVWVANRRLDIEDESGKRRGKKKQKQVLLRWG